jgi:8-oxo-dGTP diphosphatase
MLQQKNIKSKNQSPKYFLEQIGAFGDTDRYPSKRVITIGYYALINIQQYQPQFYFKL